MNLALPLLGGLALLLVGGELLLRGSGRLARALGMPRVLVAVTVVAFGTSAPELVASLTASWKGNPGMALGNVLGSNLANMALVIGLAALVRPIEFTPRLMRVEIPLLIVLQIALFPLLLLDLAASRFDGILLAVCGLVYVAMVVLRRSKVEAEPGEEIHAVPARPDRWWKTLVLVAAGLAGLRYGAEWFVVGAAELAARFGVSDRVIGLTVVSIGTSAPEIVLALLAVLRRHHSVAAGTVLGSNVFNVCFVLGITALAFPMTFDAGDKLRTAGDLVLTLAVTILLALFCARGARVGRRRAVLLVLIYAAYMAVTVRFDLAG